VGFRWQNRSKQAKQDWCECQGAHGGGFLCLLMRVWRTNGDLQSSSSAFAARARYRQQFARAQRESPRINPVTNSTKRKPRWPASVTLVQKFHCKSMI
jgi:hypothetical protein